MKEFSRPNGRPLSQPAQLKGDSTAHLEALQQRASCSPRGAMAFSGLSATVWLREQWGRLFDRSASDGSESTENDRAEPKSIILKSTIHLCAVVVICGCCTASHAQQAFSSASAVTVPRLMNFSGKLADTEGKPLAQMTGVTFAIYRDREGSAPLWLETQNVKTDGAGHYAVQLGASKSDGLSQDLFRSGEARWLGVQVSGQEEQPRVLLLSVPYALKAADSETLGGLPASAFMLAVASVPSAQAPDGGSSALPTTAASAATVTGSGTTNFLPLWTGSTSLGSSAVFQTGSGSSTKIGINTNAPASPLDVKGAATVRGTITLPATAVATASSGKNSQGQSFIASSFHSDSSSGVNQTFRWQAEPVNNNTSKASGSLNLLFGQGSAKPTETGLKIGSNGQITFAPGQTFSGVGTGTGTVTSVGLSAPTSDFTVSGSPVTKSGTLALNWNVAPASSNITNSIVKRDGTGSFNATAVQVNTLSATSNSLSIVATTSSTSNNIAALNGSATAAGSQTTYGVAGSTFGGNGAGVVGVNQNPATGYGVLGESSNLSGAVAGFNFSSSGPGVYGSGAWGFYTDNNVHQGIAAGGWVKAMAVIDDVDLDRIVRCFNSALAGAAATTPPCGFSYRKTNNPGGYAVNFGFDVTNRFVSVNPRGFLVPSVYTKGDGSSGTANEVAISLWDIINDDLSDGYFHIIVY